jgi:hypothetical protein
VNTCFSFDISRIDSKRKSNQRTAIFFFGSYNVSEEDVYRAVDAHYSWSPISDDVFFLVSTVQCASIKRMLVEGRVKNRILVNKKTGSNNSPTLLVYDHHGIISKHSCEDSSIEAVKKDVINKIRQYGCQHIFRSNSGMLEASDSHHYVKPSLKHTNRFMRTGSILVKGVEIEFLSLWLLALLKSDITCIYTDSSTINSLPYAALHLHNMLARSEERIAPAIESYESYKGLSSETVVDKEHSLVLISASSGGGMIKNLIDKFDVPASSICTIFFLGSEQAPANTICDLTLRPENEQGFPPAIVTNIGDRGQFGAHSLAIHIQSEAFVPENPLIQDINLKIEDVPKWWSEFKKSFLGRKAICCNTADPSDDSMSSPPPKPVIFRVQNAFFPGSPFQVKLNQILTNSLPASLSYIIHFEDDSSLSLVNCIREFLNKIAPKKDNIVYLTARQLTSGEKPMPLISKDSDDSTLVVAGVITDGTQLLDVAQIARNSQKNHALGFLVGLAACPSQKEFKELRSNLVYSQSGVDFGFHCCCEINAPAHYRQDDTCWIEEERFWNLQLSKLNKRDRCELVKKIEDRLGTLQEFSKSGLVDNLFLVSSSCNSSELVLRYNSVFTEGLDQALPFSQADAFFAVQATLHHLRTGVEQSRRLEQQPHRRCVLSPALFFRFSDGVIQAAILRAASHQELDYQMSQELSGKMSDVIIKILQVPLNARAEGLTEFLFALASKKIRLLKPDLAAVYNLIASEVSKNKESELDDYLCELIKGN